MARIGLFLALFLLYLWPKKKKSLFFFSSSKLDSSRENMDWLSSAICSTKNSVVRGMEFYIWRGLCQKPTSVASEVRHCDQQLSHKNHMVEQEEKQFSKGNRGTRQKNQDITSTGYKQNCNRSFWIEESRFRTLFTCFPGVWHRLELSFFFFLGYCCAE